MSCRSWGWVLVCLLGISGCKSSSDDGGGAVSLYDRMTAAREIADPLDRATALIEVGNIYAAAEDRTGAKNSLRYATEAADAVNLEAAAADRARVHISLADAWNAAGISDECEDAYEEAEDALDKVDTIADKSDILIRLALLKIKIQEADAAIKDLQAAESLTPQIGDDYEKVTNLAWVSYGYAKMENGDEANRAMAAAMAIADGQQKPGDKARLKAQVGSEQIASLSDREAGLATLADALTIARSIEGNPNLRANVLVDVAETYVKVSDPTTARQILTEAQDLVRGLSEGKPVLRRIDTIRQRL